MEQINKISKALLKGQVVLLPTDTVYGLAVHPGFPESIKRLYNLKQRPKNKNLPIMVHCFDNLLPLGLDLNKCVRLFEKSPYIPGALTLVMGFVDAPEAGWLHGREEVAVRIPNDEQLLSVLKQTGPLLVTSANLHGKITPPTFPEILDQLNGQPDLAIDGGDRPTISSTIVNCRLAPPRIEREGVVSAIEIKELSY